MTHVRRPALRTLLLTAIAAVVVTVATVATAGSARAATYQYPADGSVLGWQRAFPEETGTPPRTPRVNPAFEQVCGDTGARSGLKRVGVVVDYGRTVDGDGNTTTLTPTSACAVQKAVDTSVTLASSATAQTPPPSSVTPGAPPLVPKETAGPLVSPVAEAGTESGVPVVVWVGLIILLLGVCALAWTSARRRQRDARPQG